jgi:hypothetical protein
VKDYGQLEWSNNPLGPLPIQLRPLAKKVMQKGLTVKLWLSSREEQTKIIDELESEMELEAASER